MKIAYVSTYDVLDESTWLKNQRGNYGSNRSIAKTLENEGIKLHYIAPLNQKYRWLTRGKRLYYHHLFQQNYYSWAEPAVGKNYARQIQIQLQKNPADLVLATEGTFHLAYLQCPQPKVFWTDTCIAELIDYYPYLRNLCTETKRSILVYEKQGLEHCSLVILTSDWGKEQVIKHYDLPPEKILVLPRGANIELAPGRTIVDINRLIQQRSSTTCRLIFSGMDWQRKGGDIALQVAAWLNQQGLSTELVVLGCKPPTQDLPPFVKAIGYIDKSTPSGQQSLLDWVASAHFMILPTRADCTPNVLIEANAFGVPCLATNIAGIPTIIHTEKNGEVFPVDAPIFAYGNYILHYMKDREAYEALAQRAFREYEARLNWQVIGQMAKQHFEQLLAQRNK
jgi:glycosyltransferase involved in cell wall biosynthesis